MILDLLGAGQPACIQNCLARPDHRLYVRRAAGRVVPARPAARDVRARRRWGLDANRVLDLGIYIIIAALVGAKLLLLVVDFDQFRALARGAAVARPLGRRLLRRADPRGRRGLLVHRNGTACRSGRRATCLRRASRWATSPAGSDALRRAAATARPTNVPWAVIFTNPLAAANVGTPLGIPLHPTQLYEAGAELLILVLLLAPSAAAAHSRAARSGSTCSSTRSRATSSSSTAAIRAA